MQLMGIIGYKLKHSESNIHIVNIKTLIRTYSGYFPPNVFPTMHTFVAKEGMLSNNFVSRLTLAYFENPPPSLFNFRPLSTI